MSKTVTIGLLCGMAVLFINHRLDGQPMPTGVDVAGVMATMPQKTERTPEGKGVQIEIYEPGQ